jgi:hypothetical protein
VLVRYQGIVLVAIGAVVLATVAWTRGGRDAAVRVATFGLAASAAPAIWSLRNLAHGTGPFGPRGSAVDDPGDAAARAARVLTEWLVPGDRVGPEPPPPRILVRAVVLALVVGAGVVHRRARSRPDTEGSRSLVPLVALVVLGTAWMVATATVTPLNPLDTRLLVFVYPGLVVLVVWAVERLVRAAPAGTARTVVGTVAAVAALWWFGSSVQRWVEEVGGARDACCYPPSVLEPDRYAAALDLPPDALVYSDLPDGLWLVERRTWRWAPARSAYRSADPVDERPALAREVACAGEAWLAWYGSGRTWLFEPADLSGFVVLDPPAAQGRGDFHRLTPLPGTTRPDDC